MTKKVIFGFIAPIIIIVVAGVCFLYYSKKSSNLNNVPIIQNNSPQIPDISTTPASTSTSSSLPIPTTDQGVQNIMPDYSPTLIRYAFTGTIKSLTNVASGTQLNLINVSSDLPPIIIDSATRISKISANNSLTPLTIKDLKAGLVADISMDYEKDQKVWYLRDIYLRTDANPSLK